MSAVDNDVAHVFDTATAMLMAALDDSAVADPFARAFAEDVARLCLARTWKRHFKLRMLRGGVIDVHVSACMGWAFRTEIMAHQERRGGMDASDALAVVDRIAPRLAS